MNYIIFGDQYPLVKRTLNKILKERIEYQDEFSVVKFDMDKVSLDDVLLEAEMLPLGYERKAVILDNFTGLDRGAKKEETDAILNVIKNGTDDIDIIFVVRKAKVETSNPIYKFVCDNGRVFGCEIDKNDWPRYIKTYFEKNGAKIDDEAVWELNSRMNGDLMRFINEADKIILNKKDVKLIDIVTLVSKPIEDNVFKISDALLKGDNTRALSIYRDLQLVGSSSKDSVIAILGNQFRLISEVMYLASTGLSSFEIAKELKKPEWMVSSALRSSRRYSRAQIARVLDNLYNLDYKIKSGQLEDRSYGIELFIINFPNF